MKFARRFSKSMPSNPSPPYATSLSRQSSISSEIPTSLNPSLLSPTSSGHCDMEVVSDTVRLLTICDIFAALIEHRPYRSTMSREDAYDIVRSMDGKLEKPLVAAFKDVALTR